MLVKILGGIDIISGLILLLAILFTFPKGFLLFVGIILIIKSSIGLLKDFASWIDIISGMMLIILTAIDIPKFILLAMGVLLIQKALFSFLGE